MYKRDYRLLKELALEFIRTKNPSIFTEIIKKVDRLLLHTIHRARKRRYHLRNVELQDLYHSTIVGLYQALLEVKEDESGSKIINRIVRYTFDEILKDNKRSEEKPLAPSDEDKLVDNTLVYENLEREFIRERFRKLIDEDVISLEEFEMITMRFINNMTYKEIATQFEVSRWTVARTIKDVLRRMKYEFTKRGWEGF